MVLTLSRDLLLFASVVFGLGLPFIWITVRWSPLERLCVGVAGALTLIYLFGFGIYCLNADLGWYRILPCLAVTFAIIRWRPNVAFFSERTVTTTVGAWLLLALWSIGLQALVINYSGGNWAGDWWEHYQRAMFFHEHWPLNMLFLGMYWLPARPPLANLDTTALLALTDTTFARYQIMTTLLSTLAFLPALMWLKIFGGRQRRWFALLLFLASPVFAENVTFPATKLITAFFVLTGLALLYRNVREPDDRWARRAGWLVLAAGLLAHYSAGPWLVAAALAVLVTQRTQTTTRAYWREHVVVALLCSLLLATWFGWSIQTFGWHGTVATNSTVTGAADLTVRSETKMVLRNIADTIVPHFFRHFDKREIEQRNAWGALRDFFFNLYQVNLVFEFGTVGGIMLPYILIRRDRRACAPDRSFWWTIMGVAVLLGIAVNSQADHWGLAHICLKPLALLGLVYLAAHAASSPRWFQCLLVVGVMVDFLLGVVLQFGLESFALNRWLEPKHSDGYYAWTMSLGGQANFNAKQTFQFRLLGDDMVRHAPYVVVVLAAILASVAIAAATEYRHTQE